MMTITQMKRHVSELLDTRQSLIAKLESSHGETAELDRECDVLRRQVQRLHQEIRSLRSADVVPEATQREVERARSGLAAERRGVGSLARERDALVRRATAGRRQMHLALERARELSARYRAAEARRDAARQGLDEAVTAMGEVRGYLLRTLEEEERSAVAGAEPPA